MSEGASDAVLSQISEKREMPLRLLLNVGLPREAGFLSI
jgi:hypothetical protein